MVLDTMEYGTMDRLGTGISFDHSLAVDKREYLALELSASGSLEPQKVVQVAPMLLLEGHV